ncbi:MAG: nucleotidyltransferase domain-containing protein [Bacilli bacterium]|nr:nucleotidyltransferase domain-containing protein [Bacilli bacterium]
MNNQKKVYFKEIPSFITTISNHLGYQIQILQVKDMFSLNYDIYSKEEEKIKDYLDTYFFLLNNSCNAVNERIIKKSLFLLTNKRVNKEKVEKILTNFYSIEEEINISKIIKLSFETSNLVKNKKDKYIYFLMLINYLLLHYNFKAIKYFSDDFSTLDEVINKYKENEKELLETYITLKEAMSKNLDEDYYKNLRKVSLKDITSYLYENKEILQKKYQVESLAIFGSFVKGKERLDSDIDLIVRFERFIPLLKRNRYKEEIQEMIYQKFNRFSDIHIESELINENNIKTFKDNLKIF